MTLRILNRQRSLPINVPRLRAATECMRHAANVHDYDLSIRLTTDAVVRSLNAQYRNKRHSTDVLSFPPQRVFPPHLPPPLAPGVKVLGDVVISVQYVRRNGGELGVGLMQRIERLVAHSIVHLLGYDHETDSDAAVMEVKEQQLMSAWRQEQQRKESEEKCSATAKRSRRTKAHMVEVRSQRMGQAATEQSIGD